MKTSRLKLILLGDGRVGKTSILNKYVFDKFNENEEKTTNYSYLEKNITKNDKRYKFCIWDTAGQEQFNSLTPIYYRDAKGVILVYDILNQNSFKRVQKWTEELHSYNNEALMVFMGNKVDLLEEYYDKNNYVDKSKAEELANKENSKLFYSSAKTGEGISEAFEYIINKVIEKNEEIQDNNKKEGKFIMGDSEGENNEKGICC